MCQFLDSTRKPFPLISFFSSVRNSCYTVGFFLCTVGHLCYSGNLRVAMGLPLSSPVVHLDLLKNYREGQS